MQVCQLAREWTRECRHQSFISMNGLFGGLFKLRVIICGASAYPRDWEHERLRKIDDSESVYLLSDRAHISGLVMAPSSTIIKNTNVLGNTLTAQGYKLQRDGSDNHLILWDLCPLGITGSTFEKLCDLVHITLNKNAVAGDNGSIKEKDMEKVAEFLIRVVKIAETVQKETGKSKLLKDFLKTAEGNGDGTRMIRELKEEVEAFAIYFPLPGIPDSSTLTRHE
ncbi:PLP-dependent transferase [Atractiella rhizophila]|nr:PLP-dependent transferase [Atractiella rhizophila]